MMKTIHHAAFAAFVALSASTSAFAQGTAPADHGAMDHGAMDHGSAEATAFPPMPAACTVAGGGEAVPAAPMDHGSTPLDDVQKANMDAMNQMHGPMMAAAMLEDPDLAFNCGMIAHHRGAIAMAKVQIAFGRDAASRALAEAIIAAQEKEIAEMTAWVDAYEP